ALLRPRTRWVLRRMAALSHWPDAIIYNSRASAQQHEALGYDAARTRVLPNGFDLDHFRPDPEARRGVRAELGLGSAVPLIGIVARHHPVKDHECFLRAALRLERRGSPAHFLMAGRGVDSPIMRARIDRLGLDGRVHALGERQDIPRLTAALDVGTCSSVSESFPNAVGEAMACGVPCAVTDVGDAAWMVDNTGLVVKPRDPRGLCLAWQKLLAMPAPDRARLGAAARERMALHFGLARVAGLYEELWTEVLERRARPAAAAA
ncbi:MAG: glycosyltransferase, partial [Bryobacteraceae bacterium]